MIFFESNPASSASGTQRTSWRGCRFAHATCDRSSYSRSDVVQVFRHQSHFGGDVSSIGRTQVAQHHTEVGQVILDHNGTLERFTGDGMMIFFNDPLPVSNPEHCAIEMALAIRDRVDRIKMESWDKREYDLGLGIGLANGFATIGAIGFEGRWDYAAIGSVTNLAARLCGEASHGQILVSRRLLTAVEELVESEPVGELQLKGFHRTITGFNILGRRSR